MPAERRRRDPEAAYAHATYGAAKEAIRGLSRVAALEWGPDSIRVNIVLPFAKTEGVETWEQADPVEFRAIVDAVPLKQVGDSDTDVGALVPFLLGDDSTYLTAQPIYVAGVLRRIPLTNATPIPSPTSPHPAHRTRTRHETPSRRLSLGSLDRSTSDRGQQHQQRLVGT
ncbi:SDR family oxidoreductase [Streptomyces sp. GTA36]